MSITPTEGLAATPYGFGSAPSNALTVPGGATALLVGVAFSGSGSSPWGASVPTFGGLSMTLATSCTGSARDVGVHLYELLDISGRANDNLVLPSLGVNGEVVQATFLSGFNITRGDTGSATSTGGNAIDTLVPGSATCYAHAVCGIAGSGAVNTGNVAPYGGESAHSEATFDPGSPSSIAGGNYYQNGITVNTSIGAVISGSSVGGNMACALYFEDTSDEMVDLARLGEATGFRALTVGPTGDSMVYLTRRPAEETGFRPLTVRPFGPRQVALVGNMLGTSEMTEGGAEGKFLAFHPDRKPTWEPVGAGAAALDDLTDVNAPAPDDGDVLTWDDVAGEWVPFPAGGGVTDHGALTGLGDDDHTQYPLGYNQTSAPSSPSRGLALWYDTDDTTPPQGTAAEGTSFPSTPTTNMRFKRTDIEGGMWFFYDGTRWLSETLFKEQIINISAAVSASASSYWRAHPSLDMYLIRVTAMLYSSSLSGSAYWTIDFRKSTTAEVETSLGTASNQSLTNSVWNLVSITLNAVLAISTHPLARIPLTKVSTPGPCYCVADLYYRLIAT